MYVIAISLVLVLLVLKLPLVYLNIKNLKLWIILVD